MTRVADPGTLVRRARDTGFFVLDLETQDPATGGGSLDPITGRVRGAALAVGDSEVWLEASELCELLPLLRDPDLTWVNHHLKFDWKWTVQQLLGGVQPRCRPACTMVAAWLLDEDRPSYALDRLVAAELGGSKAAYREVREEGNLLGPTLAGKAVEDVRWTQRLWQHYQPQLRADDLERVFAVEMGIVPMLAEAELTGLPLNVATLRALEGRLLARQEAIQAELAQLTGRAVSATASQGSLFGDAEPLRGHDLNLASAKQVSHFLFVERGIPATGPWGPVPLGEGGLPSTGKDVLLQFAAAYPEVALVREWRHCNTLRTSFCLNLRRIAERSPDGRARANFNQVATVIGRLSSSKPFNTQNLPRPDPEDPGGSDLSVRAAVEEPAGFTLVDADLSQIELRSMAHWSQDAAMLAIYRADGVCPEACGRAKCRHVDLHSRTLEDLSIPKRVLAKNVNFLNLYRGGARRLQVYSGIADLATNQAWLTGMRRAYPGVTSFQNLVADGLPRRGWVARTPLGRRRRLARAARENTFRAGSQGIQFLVSGHAQDHLKDRMGAIWRDLEARRAADERYRAVRFLAQIHDEVLFRSPDAVAEVWRDHVVRSLEDAPGWRVPVRAEGGTGRRWIDAH